MKNQKKQAKVHYNEKLDRFELYIRNSPDSEWGFSRATRCMALADGLETTHIHFSFLKEVLNCISLGYDVLEG